MNRTIFMTYKRNVPPFVFSRWLRLNPSFKIDFSKDAQCYQFIKTHFNKYVADLFMQIPKGMFKADLWRLCKLYINGGVYADVDLVPHCNIEQLITNTGPKITFFSCLSIMPGSIFQAFMINHSPPKNPLILCFLMSFLLNRPISKLNGPTYDMYECIRYNTGVAKLRPEIKYAINSVKIPVVIGTSSTYTKRVPLYYFPINVPHTIKLHTTPGKPHPSIAFTFYIKHNTLFVVRTDARHGWTYPYSCDICIHSNEVVYLFQEYSGVAGDIKTCFVGHRGKKIADSRDPVYAKQKGW
jgi:hypothetical protein